MIQLQNRAYVLFALLFSILTIFTLWAVVENGTQYTLVPVISLAIFTLLLIAFCVAKAHWFSDIFKWEELRAALLITLAINLASSALLLISAEAAHIDNTLNGTNMLRISLLVGAPVGVMFWIKLSKTFDKKNIVMLKIFLISFALISATGASQLNRKSVDAEASQLTIDILRKERGDAGLTSFLTKQPPPYFVFIRNGDEEERLVVPEAFWNVTFQSATINLSLESGYFGFVYVSQFKGQVIE